MFVMHARGRLAAQPELRFLGNGSAVCEFRLLDTRFAKGRDVVEAVTFFCFDQMAEEFAGKVVKGQEIEATGTQETSEYAGSEGQKRTSIRYRLTWYHAGRKPAAARQAQEGSGGYGEAARPAPGAARSQERPAPRAPARQSAAPAAPAEQRGFEDAPSDDAGFY